MKLTIALLWLWLLALFAAHVGGRSPATYLAESPAHLLGVPVSPEATEAAPDVHGFAVATFSAFTRSTLLASALANLGAMMLLIAVAMTLAERRGLPRLPTALALAALLSLPLVTHNIAQPTPVIVMAAVNFLAVLAALALDDGHPLFLGLLVAIVIVNGQSFVFAVAILLLARGYAVFALAAAIPSIAWLAFIQWRPQVSEWIAIPWTEFFHHPIDNALLPFTSAHIGFHIAALDLLAQIDWPLLLATVVALWLLRDEIPRSRRTASVAALVVAFVAVQLVIAPFETANDPRRAIPAVLACGIAWCWAAARLWTRRAWRVAIVAVLVVCAAAAFADVVLKTPAIAYAASTQAIDANPKEPVQAMAKPLNVAPTETVQWHDVAPATVHGLLAEAFMAVLVCALLATLARASLLPRAAPWIAAVLWIASAVRFF